MSPHRKDNAIKEKIRAWVHEHYWENDDNCATVMISSLAKLFSVEIEPQIWAAAVGMHGAGGYQGQCGLVEGSLLFIGIYGNMRKMPREQIVMVCKNFAKAFEVNYSSISCKELRPNGFRPEDPPHPCEAITVEAVWFAYQWILSLA